ncbi:hypothetical protein C7M84_022041 [Penaeus vannamei]|uniref:Uncharacterized protein n=1 Tax=Penaeus vannamei TaxID=6689 RepID=A0A423U7X5_PENVA|nr:hypothetical protein C7M84_022041 [Penaeus vannamei]
MPLDLHEPQPSLHRGWLFGRWGGSMTSQLPPPPPSGISSSVYHTPPTTPPCTMCHVPYSETSLPFRVKITKCVVCSQKQECYGTKHIISDTMGDEMNGGRGSDSEDSEDDLPEIDLSSATKTPVF